jgi:Fic family protein
MPEAVAARPLAWEADALSGPRHQGKGVERAIVRLRVKAPALIYNDASLEGNTFTLPEVQTLLDGGLTVGHRVEEADQILDLSEATNRLIAEARRGPAAITRTLSDGYNAILARHEAIEAGRLRGTGAAAGGGYVHAMGVVFAAPAPGPGGETLARLFDEGVERVSAIGDVAARACVWAAYATYHQFYFDGNKRTSRYVMNTVLVSHGYDSIVVPATRRTDYNEALRDLFLTADATGYARFLLSCWSD